MAKENNGFDLLFVELGLVSPKKEANQQPQKKQKRNNNGEDDTAKILTAEKELQQLLESNIVRTDQTRAAHASLKEELKKSKEENTENCSIDNTKMVPIQEKDKSLTVDYRTRHIALHVYYDGKHYSGLAQNVGMESDNYVEHQLFRALQTTRLVQLREACG